MAFRSFVKDLGLCVIGALPVFLYAVFFILIG